MTREQQQKACEDARNEAMKVGLAELAAWATRRVAGTHDAGPTLALLDRHVAYIRQAVDRAGMRAISDIDTETWP